ncbi:hypothetical protein ACJ6WF_44220 [Streptomyces sp. MMS24-I2-30]|uniref:hypothetical protein n=1 Tax=Streptomyces sp. MMS24-I2-30 TaxID=3351564 RepID=UPI003896C6DD
MDTMSDGADLGSEHRTATATARGTAHTLRHAVAALLAAWLVVLGAGTGAHAAPGDGLIKVFVVPDPAQTGGQPATLPSIAAATLGDPARSGEILDLNRGLAQQDGGALTGPDDPLHPGWILRLPQDASGPAVQLARDTGNQDGATLPPGTGQRTPPGTAPSTMFTIPLAAAVAVLATILLALVTAGIVGRRRVRVAYTAVLRALRGLGEPVRRRRRLTQRRTTGRRFAADSESVRRAYGVLGEFVPTRRRPERPVHAVRVDERGATVWLTAADTADAPWTHLDSTRWRRSTTAAGRPARTDDTGPAAPASITTACLVRAGADSDGAPVFVDLSRLDGVLSVSGDRTVARDVVQNLLAEVARTRPDTAVTVLRGADGGPPLTVPTGLRQLPRVAAPAPSAPAADLGTVRAGAARRPVRGVVVVAGTPDERVAAELAALCGPGGAGWTGLVHGEVSGAHWRWHTDADGRVDIPVLDVRLTVPA